ncbi:MAG: hypothetical protein LBH86_03240 [Oscillospiraceae bacterium]|jgi:hypothetical protein|nr:hypothetical protein [Oscillospiraceae bacterium]
MLTIDYNRIKQYALDALVLSGIRTLPVDVVRLCERHGWVCLPHTPGDPDRAADPAFRRPGADAEAKTVLRYVGDPSQPEVRWAMAREAGLLLMRDEPPGEQGVAFFVEQLLMPLPVLERCDIHTVQEIQRLCEVPTEAATAVLRNLTRYRTYKIRFGASELDEKFLEQFTG